MRILDKIQESVPNCSYHVDVGIGTLERHIEQYSIDLDPVYQRGHVWTELQEELFVGAFLENNNSMPPFWMNWTGPHHASSEVVDGKQRIKACRRWLKGEIIARCPCGIDIWHKDLDDVDRTGLLFNFSMSWNFVDLSPVEVMKFYLRLNAGGTIHSPKELDKVRKLIARSDE